MTTETTRHYVSDLCKVLGPLPIEAAVYARGCNHDLQEGELLFTEQQMRAYATDAVAAEREQCAKPAAVQQPLTNGQAERLYRNIKPSAQQDARSCAAFKRLVRVVEATHGIGGKP